MAKQTDAGRSGGATDGGDARAPAGRMIYHLFASEERRRIVSIFLDNHAVAFSAPAMSSATKMDTATAGEMLHALATVGFLAAMEPNEAYQLAGSEGSEVERIVGDLEEDDTFYRLNKGDEFAKALAKADSVAARRAADFYRAAPDIDQG